MTDLSIHRVLPHAPAVLVWVLALALGVQAALIVRSLLPQPKSTPAPIVAQSAGPASGNRSADLQTILNAHLFGDATVDPAAASNAADAPKTQLNLVLAGTIAVDDPAKGMALIGPTAVNAKVYSVGESVDGGVRLHEVYADRAILDRGGQLEALYLPRQMSGSAPPPRPMTPPPSQGAALANRVRQMVAQDAGTITDVMRPQPVFADGKQRGFRVYPGRKREQFSRLGLQPGDLITAINGTPLDDPARGMEVFRTMGSASQVSVTLERGGQKQELVLDMTQLTQQINELAPSADNPPDDPVAPPPSR